MEIKKVLGGLGLSEGEVKVYLALLKLGSVPISKIKEETNLHRTTIYDFVEKLLNKGLAGYVIKNNVRYYKAAHPSRLVDFIKEKEESVREIIPQLTRLTEFKKEEIKVELYKGEEGLKTLINDVLRVKKDIVVLGVDELKFKEKFPIVVEQYFKKEEETGIKERLLASEDTEFIFDKKTTNYRFIPEKFFNPTSTMVYGDKVAILIWEPFIIIMIENKGLADSYRKYFELLWKIAKKKPKKQLKKIKFEKAEKY